MDRKTSSDAELMTAVAAGDMASLGKLVHRHQEKVLSLAMRMLGRWDLAEDAAQEAFLRVQRAAGGYVPKARFTTWLYRITANVCLDMLRKCARAPVQTLEDGVLADDPSGPDHAERRELIEHVARAVGELPPRQRAVVVLYAYEGLSHREVAEATGWSVSAVESLLVRAYANLRRALAGLEGP